MKLGMDKPHIFWSKYWGAFEVKLDGLSRIGTTIEAAWNAFRAAQRSGAKR